MTATSFLAAAVGLILVNMIKPGVGAKLGLGAAPFDRFVSVALPLARAGFVTGAVLGFAHTVGEFGVILMIGGDLPGETRVASIALYDFVERLEWEKAHLESMMETMKKQHAEQTKFLEDSNR